MIGVLKVQGGCHEPLELFEHGYFRTKYIDDLFSLKISTIIDCDERRAGKDASTVWWALVFITVYASKHVPGTHSMFPFRILNVITTSVSI